MHITIATTSYSTLSDIAIACQQLTALQREQVTFALFQIENKITAERWDSYALTIQSTDLFLYDPHGADADTMDRMIKAAIAHDIDQMTMMLQGSDTKQFMKLDHLIGNDLELHSQTQALQLSTATIANLNETELTIKQQALAHAIRIQDYWRAAGVNNWLQLIYYLGHNAGYEDFPLALEPVQYQELGIIDPDSQLFYGDVDAYWTDTPFDVNKPIVALFYLANNSRLYTSGVVSQIVRRLRAVANVLPIGIVNSMKVNVPLLGNLLNQPHSKVNAIVNFLGFRLGVGPRGEGASSVVDMLERLAVPILHPFFLSRLTEEEWKQSTRGLSSSEVLVHIVLPELDGNIETYPVAAMKDSGFDEVHQITFRELAIIEERVDHLVTRVGGWLNLQRKANAEKRVAIICYNYPPGEGNLFGGSFLDTFASVSHLLLRLQTAGYNVEALTAEELRNQFLQGQLVNTAKWADQLVADRLIRYGKSEYDRKLKLEAIEFQEKMNAQWGPSPGTVMAEDEDFLIPGLQNGNVFIGLQPTRGIHENPEKVYHDETLLPPHQYAAYYQWVREEFAADAIIHVGTHGTLEFLPGKESGMSGNCFSDRFIGHVPHLYYYYVGNPSEGMIAKRRSHASLVSYQSPPFLEGGLYDSYAELDKLVHEYREASRLDPERCAYIWTEIVKQAKQIELKCEDFTEVEDELYLLKRSMIPYGLHILGHGYAEEEAIRHMGFVLRHDHKEAPALRRLLAQKAGLDYDYLLEKNNVARLAELDVAALLAVEAYIKTGAVPAAEAELSAVLGQTLAYGKIAYEASLHNEEIEGMLRGLDGHYLSVKLAGDVIRNPEILPTGRNMYQLDPRAIPSAAAIKRGEVIASNTIALFHKEQGRYPHTTALVIWGIETARTQGESIGQVLHYLGVRLGTRFNSFQTPYEIIPLEELGRPRLNIVVNISGIFRDMFSGIIDDLNGLFKKIALLDEPEEMNFFKKQTIYLQQQLSDDGFSSEEAFDFACARIFGPAEGEYGTGVTTMIETKNWTDESQIGEMYNKALRHVYSGNARGKEMSKLFDSNLEAVDIVSQLRSEHEHEIVDLDHYYEYFGGLSKTIEKIKGKKAEIYISDTTGETVRTEDVRDSINRGVRTRLLNPKWIDGLLEHPYHGTQKIAQRVENVLGLAATTNKVDNWVFSSIHETYVADEARSKQLEENNKHAYHAMIETMLESYQRQYWSPTTEQLALLQQKYMELESEIEA